MKLVNKMRLPLTLLFLGLFTNIFAQNTTTLVVSGQGNTQLEAQHNALRSAIEQASGAFISSNTEILNNEVIKDEIISITNGNIQEFTIISEIKIPNGEYAVTLKATVSLQKLVSFINNNGGQAELNGGLFAANVKQQVLNEENEVKTIQNMCNVLDEIAKEMFTYNIRVAEPISVKGDNSLWQIKMQVRVGFNDNSSTYAKYMFETIDGLKMTKEEISSYLKLNKNVFPVTLTLGRERPKETEIEYYIFEETLRRSVVAEEVENFLNSAYSGNSLRSNESINLIINQLLSIKEQLLDFKINNEIKAIKGRDYYEVQDEMHYSFLLHRDYTQGNQIYQGTMFDPFGDKWIRGTINTSSRTTEEDRRVIERESKLKRKKREKDKNIYDNIYRKLPKRANLRTPNHCACSWKMCWCGKTKFTNMSGSAGNQFYITYDEIDMQKQAARFASMTPHDRKYNQDEALNQVREKENIFRNQFRKVLLMQKETDWWKYCATINKKGQGITQRNLGLVISFSNFYNTQYYIIPKKYTWDGKIESPGGFETNNGIATLIYKQNLTLEELGKIKDYKINN